MAVTININDLSLVHQDSGGIATATLPDICMTPTPGGPVPVRYPNIARSVDLKNGTRTITVDGGNSAAIQGSEFYKSTGDEQGTLGGIISGVNMSRATWLSYSFDVKYEGKGACRLTDKMLMNDGNTACLAGVVNPPIKSKKWDVKCVLEVLCKEDKDVVEDLANQSISKTDTLIFDDLYYNGKKWITKRFYAGGTADGTEITIDRNATCTDALEILYHELWHMHQDSNKLDTSAKAEIDAYLNTEEWLIRRGLPTHAEGFRTTDSKGNISANLKAIVKYVNKEYPAASQKAGPVPIDKTDFGFVKLSDGSIRRAKKGDVIAATKPTNNPHQKTIDQSEWKCPE